MVWRVVLDGIAVLHAGDSGPTPAELRVASAGGVDLFLAPWWILTGPEGADRIAATRARHAAAMHAGRRDQVVLPVGIALLRSPGQRISTEVR